MQKVSESCPARAVIHRNLIKYDIDLQHSKSSPTNLQSHSLYPLAPSTEMVEPLVNLFPLHRDYGDGCWLPAKPLLLLLVLILLLLRSSLLRPPRRGRQAAA